MKVLVLSARRFKAHHDVFPLRVFAPDLRRAGIDVSFSHGLVNRALADADVVLVSSYQARRLLGGERSGEGNAGLVRRLARYPAKIIWFDSTDTGNIAHPEVVPWVSVYAKEQLWKDRQMYEKPLYQGVLFKDYYRRHHGVEDLRGRVREPAEAGAVAKLDLAWNLGLSDWRMLGRGRLTRVSRIFFPRANYHTASRPVLSLQERSVDISCRVRPWPDHRIVNFHRRSALSRVRGLGRDHLVCCEGMVNSAAYHRELHQARIVASPFGWGEICWRDFECNMAGALQLKPDMSHLSTWPEFYEADVTYVPHRWDYADFEEKARHILRNPRDYQHIADHGRRLLFQALGSDGGRRKFVEHFAIGAGMREIIRVYYA